MYKCSFEFLKSLFIWPVHTKIVRTYFLVKIIHKHFLQYMKPSNHNKDLAVSCKVKVISQDHVMELSVNTCS